MLQAHVTQMTLFCPAFQSLSVWFWLAFNETAFKGMFSMNRLQGKGSLFYSFIWLIDNIAQWKTLTREDMKGRVKGEQGFSNFAMLLVRFENQA